MRIPVAQIDDQDLHLAGTLAAPEEATVAGQLELAAPLAFSVHVVRDGGRIRLRGWLHTTARVGCSRCLVLTPYTVDRQFEIILAATGQAPRDSDTELDASDLDVDYYAEGELDLGALLVEQINLDLPMKLLCSEDCQGLCPQCGANQNTSECDCEPVRDPRLSPLAGLRDRL